MNRQELESKVIQWGYEKRLYDPVKQTLKTLSEAGELADAVCKSDLDTKVFDLGENGELDDVIDAIGDIEVCLTILKNQVGLNQEYPLECAWEVIKERTGQTVNGTFIKDS
jgi:NTP pyrophosphatase (non-canonical NTP hydrolase)